MLCEAMGAGPMPAGTWILSLIAIVLFVIFLGYAAYLLWALHT